MTRHRQYSPIERLGINAVERRVLGWAWIFREQPISDFGVDAEIEICDAGVPTGLLMKFQIKAGSSWFRGGGSAPIAYYAKERHISYWLDHALPVVLVLWDPGSDRAYWSHVSSSTVRKTAKGFVVDVPRSNDLDASPVSLLRKIGARPVGPLQDLAAIAERATRSGPGRSRGGLEPLLDALATARRTIDFATFALDIELVWALRTASRHAATRLLVGECSDDLRRDYDEGLAESPTLQLRVLPDLHLKQVGVDGRLLIYGSASATRAGWREHPQFIVGTTDPRIVASATRAFDALWARGLPP